MNITDIPENIMTKIRFYVSDLDDLKVTNDEYKIKSINFLEKEIIFFNSNNNTEYKIKFDEINKKNMQNKVLMNTYTDIDKTSELNTDQNKNDFSMTSENNIPGTIQSGGNNKNILKSSKYSDTSELNTEQNINDFSMTSENKILGTIQSGGNNKNIFKSSKHSDTSSVKFTELSNYSKTSNIMYNDRTDNFSDTSIIGQIGGGIEITDTLRSISELKDRNNKASTKNSISASASASALASASTFKSNLDMGIFKKSQNQSGGSKSNLDLKKKMLEAGINSSSTSSMCE